MPWGVIYANAGVPYTSARGEKGTSPITRTTGAGGVTNSTEIAFVSILKLRSLSTSNMRSKMQQSKPSQ